MKVIDLLNKMANKEEMPQKIKYANYNFESYFNKINELIEKVNEIKNEN